MKPKLIRTSRWTFHYEYNGWHIERQGGFSMMRHYSCTKGEMYFWTFKLKEVVPFADAMDAGKELPTTCASIYLRPLYI